MTTRRFTGSRGQPAYDNRIHGRHDYDHEAYPDEPEESIAFRVRAADALFEKMTRKEAATIDLETLAERVAAKLAERMTPTTSPTAAPVEGPVGGRWVWWKGTRHDVPRGVVFALIKHMWGCDAASYDDELAREVFDDLPAPQTIRARASDANLALRRIGVPWRLRCDAIARMLTKES